MFRGSRRRRGHRALEVGEEASFQRTQIQEGGSAKTEQGSAGREAVGRHGYLTTDLIELAFFRSGRPDDRASSAAYERLRLLWLWGYLDRVDVPLLRLTGGRRPFLYALGPAGVRVVNIRARRAGHAIRRQRPHDPGSSFVAHNLIASTLWANLVAATRGSAFTLRRWETARDLRARGARVKDPGHRALAAVPSRRALSARQYGRPGPTRRRRGGSGHASLARAPANVSGV